MGDGQPGRWCGTLWQVREHDIRAADGTRIRVWRSGETGRDVLLCPGLGTRPAQWPELNRPGTGRWLRVHGWYPRPRPADQVADALAVLDDAGIDRVVVIGCSAGVPVAAELAGRCPDRVSGLLLVAGAPVDPFGGLLGVLGVPPAARRVLAAAIPRRLVRWADAPVPNLANVCCPVTALAGRYDLVTDPRHLVRTVGPLPQARVRVLPTGHSLPLAAPDELADELRLLIERADAVLAAARWFGHAVPAPRSAPDASEQAASLNRSITH